MNGSHPAVHEPGVEMNDVLERVLTKGIVISYESDVSVLGLNVIEIDGHAVVTSLETYLQMTEPLTAEAETNQALMTAVDEYLRRLPTRDDTDTTS